MSDNSMNSEYYLDCFHRLLFGLSPTFRPVFVGRLQGGSKKLGLYKFLKKFVMIEVQKLI